MNYLISAESYRIIDDEIKKMVKGNNYILFNANRCTIKEIIEEASYFSLDDSKKWIVVSNADFFGTGKISESDNEFLSKYLENSNETTNIIFTTLNGIDLRKKIVKSIKNKGSIINIPKMDKRNINSTLTSYLKNYDYSIDYKTLNYIMDNSYNNLDIMFNELDKIMIYYGFPCTIKYNDVLNIVGEEKTNNNFAFVNAVIEKNLKLSLKILKSLKIYKVEPTVLVSLLAREYRLMYYVKNLYNKMSMSDIMSYLSLADWQINKFYTNSSKFSNKELLGNLVKLCDIDLNIKKGVYDKDISLYGFLMDACS
jgi:DNA polymerase III, delta subunit